MANEKWYNNDVLLGLFLIVIFLIGYLAMDIYIFREDNQETIKKTDADNDGFYIIALEDKDADCNDDDSTIYPGALETEGDGIDQDCDGYDKLPDFNPDEPKDKFEEFNKFWDLKNKPNRYIKIYENFVTPSEISSRAIIENSKRIETSGKFEKAYLYVVAKVDKKDTSDQKLTDGESVYFYIDTGEKGGHLIKSKIIELDKEKLDNTVSNFVYKASNIELTSIPYRDVSTPVFKKVNFLEILNSENSGYYRKHYIGAFVSSNLGKGELVELGIVYECKFGYLCLIKDITGR